MHYTLTSGKRTDTITSRCPTCLKVRKHRKYITLDDTSVCCSMECYDIYHAKLIQLYKKALEWSKADSPYHDSVCVLIAEYLIHEGH